MYNPGAVHKERHLFFEEGVELGGGQGSICPPSFGDLFSKFLEFFEIFNPPPLRAWFQMQKHTLSSLSHMSRHPRSAPPSDVKNQLNKMAPNGLQSEMAEPSKRTTKQSWSALSF